ncbi:MAG: hypothetical protein JST92_05765 [Deltaproteobacteria bacterium]|nr:hypothetical protein [Deltaproteobacteria bacterium]
MGGFYTSLHLRLSEGTGSDGLGRAVREVVTAGGEWSPHEGGGEPDLVLLLSEPREGHPWVTLFDERLDQDDASLDAFAAQLTRALGTWSVGVLIHDSDVIVLRLHHQGALVDVFNSRPDCFGRVTSKEAREQGGRAQHWKPLLAEGTKVADLRAWMKSAERFTVAEEAAEKVSPLLGLEPRLVLNSFKYLHEDEPEQRVALAKMTRLAFRRVPKVQQGSPARMVTEEKGRRSDAYNESADGERAVGETFWSQVSFQVADGRCLSEGFRVELTGSALEAGIVVPHRNVRTLSVQVFWKGGIKTSEAPWSEVEPGKRWRAQFKRGAIPAPKAALVEKYKLPDDGMMCSFQVNASLATSGAGALKLCMIPDENTEGSASVHYALSVVPLPQSPFPRKGPIKPRGWAPFLHLHRKRIAAATLYLRPSAAPPGLVASVAARWAAFTQPSAEPAPWTFIGDVVAERVVPGPGLSHLPGWSEFAGKLGSGSAIVRRGGLQAAPPASIGSRLAPRSDGISSFLLNDGVALFGLWHYFEGASPSIQERGAALLDELVNELASAVELQQAFITRWDWAPISTSATPYEQVADFRASTTRPYASVDLRAVSEQMWLGPGLAARVDLENLRAMADVRPVGANFEVRLHPGRGIEELEVALLPILPARERFDPNQEPR